MDEKNFQVLFTTYKKLVRHGKINKVDRHGFRPGDHLCAYGSNGLIQILPYKHHLMYFGMGLCVSSGPGQVKVVKLKDYVHKNKGKNVWRRAFSDNAKHGRREIENLFYVNKVADPPKIILNRIMNMCRKPEEWSPLGNNCETFCEMASSGKPVSDQVRLTTAFAIAVITASLVIGELV
jgi:hypothetical protein